MLSTQLFISQNFVPRMNKHISDEIKYIIQIMN